MNARRSAKEFLRTQWGMAAWGVAGAAAAGAALSAWQHRHGASFAGRTVIISGGSRGLGLVMARQLADESANLVLLARDRRELRRAEQEVSARGASVLALPCNVGDERSVEGAVRQAVRKFGAVDVLINNAGIIQVGPLEHMRLEDFRQAMAVHFFGPLYLIQEVLPYMRSADGGRIVNISSIGCQFAAPHLAPYSASKFALTGLSDALRAELRTKNIYVTTVIPGLMRTGSPPNAQFKGRHREEYAWFTIADSLPLLSMSAERAARKILGACRTGSPRLVLGVSTKAAILVDALFPKTTARVSAGINRLLLEGQPDRSEKVYSGWESGSRWAPSRLTALTDKAAGRNNEEMEFQKGETIE